MVSGTQAGIYPVIVLSGSYHEMGRQYGGLMKTELNDEYSYLINTVTSQGITKEEIMKSAREVHAYYPERIKEIFTGMSETTGRTMMISHSSITGQFSCY